MGGAGRRRGRPYQSWEHEETACSSYAGLVHLVTFILVIPREVGGFLCMGEPILHCVFPWPFKGHLMYIRVSEIGMCPPPSLELCVLWMHADDLGWIGGRLKHI